MSRTQTRTIDGPCCLCGAPAGMTCLEYEAVKQLNTAFDRLESALATAEEETSRDRTGRIGVPEVIAS